MIRTTGDRVQDRPLAEIGGKGLFTKEIEEALLAGAIDIAVHSMKDMPTVLPAGLAIAALLPREDVRDAFVSRPARARSRRCRRGRWSARPRCGAARSCCTGGRTCRWSSSAAMCRPGCASWRRASPRRPSWPSPGLRRLGLDEVIRAPVEPDEMLPAVAQGAIGIEARAGDEAVAALLAPIDDAATGVALAAERAFLAGLDGSCRTPIGGLAVPEDGGLWFRGEIIRPDGSERIATERRGAGWRRGGDGARRR